MKYEYIYIYIICSPRQYHSCDTYTGPKSAQYSGCGDRSLDFQPRGSKNSSFGMMIFTAKNDKTKGFSTTHPRLGIFLANSESSRRPCQKNSYRMNPLQIPEFHDLLLRSWTATSHKHVDFSENLRKHHGTLQKNHGLS